MFGLEMSNSKLNLGTQPAVDSLAVLVKLLRTARPPKKHTAQETD